MGVRTATVDDAGGPCAEVSPDRRRLWRRHAAWTLVSVVTLAATLTATACASSPTMSTTEQIEAAWDRYLRLSTELANENPSHEARAVSRYSHGDATDELAFEVGLMSMLGMHIPSTRTSEDVVVTMVDDTTATMEPCVVTDMEAFEANGRRAEAQVTAERVRVRLELLDGDRWSVAKVENGRGEC